MSSSVTDERTLAETKPQREYHWLLKQRHILVISGVSVLAVASIVSVWSFRPAPPKVPSTARNQESQRTGEIRVAGTTEAVRMQAIVAPMLENQQLVSLTITKLASSGTHVHKGDLLVDFDRQAQMRTLIDKQNEYQELATKAVQEQAKEDITRAKDETEIQTAESDLGKAELKMQKVEVLSRIEAEKAQQELEEAKATLQARRATFDLKRKSGHSAVRRMELQRDRAQQVMQHARANVESMEIKSPMDGIVVLNAIQKQDRQEEVKEGDQVQPGVPFMQVVDPSAMQVRASVNQEDFLSLHFGDVARIHLDAYPGLVFPGKLVEMAPVAHSGDFPLKLHSFAVVFSIGGTDPKLMPDLSAAVDVTLSTKVDGAGAFH